MASIGQLLTTPRPPISTTTTTTFPKPRYHAPSRKFSSLVISCKAANSSGGGSSGAGKPGLDRRNMLLGLGGLYGLSATGRPALGSPIMPPDFTKCSDPVPGVTNEDVHCCLINNHELLDFGSEAIDFVPPNPAKLRMRRPAHQVDEEYIAKYSTATWIMKNVLDQDKDPRSFKHQAKIHCAFCDGAYTLMCKELQIHSSWLFFPWHRCYLYFYERILGRLIGDDDFALPFWNWDSPDGMTMPTIYTQDKISPLYDELRDHVHRRKGYLVDLDYNGSCDPTYTPAEQVDHNLRVMHRQMITRAETADAFLGCMYKAGDDPHPGAGSLENMPHNTVHNWTGDRKMDNGEDMGALYAAARDPIFFSHHSNVDRMWEVWKELDPSHRDFVDEDWLNATFLFWDENGQQVKIRVADCLDTKKLGYMYEDVPIPWINTPPIPTLSIHAPENRLARLVRGPSDPVGFPLTLELEKPVSVVVKRPAVSRSKEDKDARKEMLVVSNIKLSGGRYTKFDVYLNVAADEVEALTEKMGPGAAELVGSFTHIAHSHKDAGAGTTTSMTLGITSLLEEILADADEAIVVTLVLRTRDVKVSVGGIDVVLTPSSSG